MADMLARGMQFLHGKRHQHMSRTVVYSREGQPPIELQATVGQTSFDENDQEGVVHRYRARDFLVRAADLQAVALFPPLDGDLVTEVDTESTYEVMSMGNTPPWSWSDRSNTVIRLHTKQVGTQ